MIRHSCYFNEARCAWFPKAEKIDRATSATCGGFPKFHWMGAQVYTIGYVVVPLYAVHGRSVTSNGDSNPQRRLRSQASQVVWASKVRKPPVATLWVTERSRTFVRAIQDNTRPTQFSQKSRQIWDRRAFFFEWKSAANSNLATFLSELIHSYIVLALGM